MPVRIAIIKRQETRSLGYNVKNGKLLCIPWWECKFVENSIKVPQKLIELPYEPAIPLLGIHLKKTKILIQKDKCTPMFTKMYAIVKSLYITPELTLYFSLFNTHTKNLTENPEHFVFSMFHLLLFSCLSKCLWVLCILHYNGSPKRVPFTAQIVPQLTGYHFTI